MKNEYFSTLFPQKSPFSASKSQNFEKLYKISPKILTILYHKSKNYACYNLFVGARLFSLKFSCLDAHPGNKYTTAPTPNWAESNDDDGGEC